MKGKKNKDLRKFKCFNCGEMGHFLLRCVMKKEGYDKKKKGKQFIGVATSTEIVSFNRGLEEEKFVMISHFSHGTIDEDEWYVQSGVTKHMTGS